MPYGSIIPPPNLLLLAAKQEPYTKAYLLMKNIWNIFPETVQENGPASRKKDQTERVIGLGRRTREEIVKWNQMTALRFHTGGRHQTSPASLQGTIQRILPLQGQSGLDQKTYSVLTEIVTTK